MILKREKISKEKSDYILSLKYEDLTKTKIKQLTSNRFDVKTRKSVKEYNLTDELIIPIGRFNNTSPIISTVGRYIFNTKIVVGKALDVLGYINEPVTKKVLENIYSKMGRALLDDVITTEDMASLYGRIEWFFNFTFSSTPSFTEKTYKPDPMVIKKREELLKKYEKEIANGDVTIGVKIRDELLQLAKERNQGDAGFDLFNSGAIGNFDNNYGSFNVMKGATYNPETESFKIVTSNYMEGIKKEDITPLANNAIESTYSKGVGTQIGGYGTKKNLASFQSLVLDKSGTDCGTKLTQSLFVSDKVASLILYSYIVEGSNLIMLTDDNIGKYINKTVKLRSPLYCKSDKICNKCAGELYYKLGISNVGLTIIKESSSLLNKFMKTFHDSTVKLYNIEDPNKFIY